MTSDPATPSPTPAGAAPMPRMRPPFTLPLRVAHDAFTAPRGHALDRRGPEARIPLGGWVLGRDAPLRVWSEHRHVFSRNASRETSGARVEGRFEPVTTAWACFLALEVGLRRPGCGGGVRGNAQRPSPKKRRTPKPA